MWQKISDIVTTVITLAEDIKEYQEELKDVRQELRQLTGIVQRLAARMEANEKTQGIERENLALKLQLELTRMEQRLERRLPPPPTKPTQDE